MSEKSHPDTPANLPRRQWLKYAGVTAAAGGLALGARQADAGTAKAGQTPDGVLDVAIIGAGLAGLTAARDLQLAGCNSFVVLEARDRVGGRTLNYSYFETVSG